MDSAEMRAASGRGANTLTPLRSTVVDPLPGGEGNGRRLPFTVLVVGPAGSGKSTIAARLGELLGVRVAETSRVVIGSLAEYEAGGWAQGGHSLPELIELYWSNKGRWRGKLAAFGDALTSGPGCGACLIESAARIGSIVVGARRKIEFEGWLASAARRADVLIEVVDTGGGARFDDVFELSGVADSCGHYLKTFKVCRSLYPAALNSLLHSIAEEIHGRTALFL